MKAYAKVNLSLDVLGKRPDGYHELRMVTQSVDLCDDIDIELTDGEISVSCGKAMLPNDSRNLAVAAAQRFFSHTELKRGAAITLNKRIPVGAGLGGGSSDAAAVLRLLNQMAGSGLTAKELEVLGEQIGSDVPFCVSGGTQLVEGRGEVLTPLTPLPDCVILICKPQKSLSTARVFGWRDTINNHPDNGGMVEALNNGDLPGFALRMFNSLEDAVSRRVPELSDIRWMMARGGAAGVSMSGTGTSMVGLFTNRNAARETYNELSALYPHVFLTRPVKT